ncbi:hypothetical protein [Haloferax sp. Atlit-6N]|uniref:hypothetical protein n=1 Tax=Haloferax sp. Atlit-6N TaxID=2077205 RepID=UPI0011C05D51|nr:hypothetical protein [Haloferax sp. Atlit-6N]
MKRTLKLEIICVLAMISVFSLVFVQDGTKLPYDPYWRYQGNVLAEVISEQSRLPGYNSFSEGPELIGWLERFVQNTAGPLMVVISSYVWGVSVIKVQNLPIFTPAMILTQALLAKQLVGRRPAFFSGIVLAVVFKFLNFFQMTSAHRGAIVWLLYLLIIYTLSMEIESRKRLSLLFVVAPALLFAGKTVPVAHMVLFSIITIGLFLSKYTSTGHVAASIYLLMVIATSSIIFGFFAHATALVIPYLQSGIDLGGTSSNYISSYLYTIDYTSPYRIAFVLSGIVSLILLIYSTKPLLIRISSKFTSINRQELALRPHFTYSIVLVALISQGIVNTVASFVVGGSGGLNPIILAIVFTPIFGSYLFVEFIDKIQKGGSKTKKVALISVAVILISVPMATTYSVQDSVSAEVNGVSSSELHSGRWASTFASHEKFISDFNYLSVLHTVDSGIYTDVPGPGTPPYATPDKGSKLVSIYYTDPKQAFYGRTVFVVTGDMKNTMMIHLGSVETVPNPDLPVMLSAVSNKTYTNGGTDVYMSDSVNS